MDFIFEEKKLQKYSHRVALMETEEKEIFSDKLLFLYFEVPKFSKQLHELTSATDRWLYAFKHLHKLRDKPAQLQEAIFERLFSLAEISSMNPQEQGIYNESLKTYRDHAAASATLLKEGRAQGRVEGRVEGRAEGRAEGKLEGQTEKAREVVLASLKQGLSVEVISSITGLSQQQVKEIEQQAK